jgi:hypothetical protein
MARPASTWRFPPAPRRGSGRGRQRGRPRRRGLAGACSIGSATMPPLSGCACPDAAKVLAAVSSQPARTFLAGSTAHEGDRRGRPQRAFPPGAVVKRSGRCETLVSPQAHQGSYRTATRIVEPTFDLNSAGSADRLAAGHYAAPVACRAQLLLAWWLHFDDWVTHGLPDLVVLHDLDPHVVLGARHRQSRVLVRNARGSAK